ncbi:MAG: BON domain-containing protein [Acidimicrobiales bacterium]
MKFIVRLLILPFKLVLAVFEKAFRLGRLVGGVPLRIGRRTSRVMGLRGVIGLLVGLALGLLFAPGPGRELRERLRALQARRAGVSDSDLAERVVFELEHAPRTWHLPQPTVTVVSGRAILSGTVAQSSERDELGRVAAAVPGVAAVDNLLEVDSGLEPAPDPR